MLSGRGSGLAWLNPWLNWHGRSRALLAGGGRDLLQRNKSGSM